MGGEIPQGRLSSLPVITKGHALRGLAAVSCPALFLLANATSITCSEQLRSRSSFRWQWGRTLPCCAGPWCDADAAAASECHHENSSRTPSVAGDEDCDNVAVAVTAVLREDVRRDVSSRNANQAIPVPRYQLAQLTIGARPGEEPWREWSLEKRPLSPLSESKSLRRSRSARGPSARGAVSNEYQGLPDVREACGRG